MMKQISGKDKKMLIILAIFLVGIAYYLFLLTPLQNMNDAAAKLLVAKRKKLLVLKTKLAGINGYRKKIRDLREVICINEKSSNMPGMNEKLNNKMKAVMIAAKKAVVNITSLKPMNVVKENEDGSVQTIKDKHIAIDGKTNINSFLNFLQNLWGTALEEVELTSTSRDGSDLRFYIKVAFLPKMLNIKVDPTIETPERAFGVKNNVFAPIRPPMPKPPPKPEVITPPKPVHQLDNVKLLGIAEFGDSRMAILEDGNKKQTDFFLIGSTFRETRVSEITKNSVVFLYPDGDTLTLKLPEDKKYYTINEGSSRKKGHLGILAETFTEELAREYSMEFRPGLLVISSGSHDDVLKKGDVISSINGQPVSSFEDALEIMKSVYSGQKINVTIFRHDKMMTVNYKAD